MVLLQGPDKVLLQTQQLFQGEQTVLHNHIVFQMNILDAMNRTENHPDIWISNLKITETKYSFHRAKLVLWYMVMHFKKYI